MAARSKFTTETRAAVVEALEKGHYVESAAALAGVSRSTLYAWLERGRAAKRGPYRQFADDVEAASAQAENDAIEEARDGTPHAAQWFLERRFSERWGKRERRDVTVNDGGPIVVELRWPTGSEPPATLP